MSLVDVAAGPVRLPWWGMGLRRPVARSAVGVATASAWVAPGLVGLFALGLRLVPTLWSGGWLALGRYDDGVYFGSALALTHGQLPYRDVLLLHPPGITLLLAPFALLAGLVGDAAAFAAAKVLVMVVGAASAAGIAWLVREHGRAPMVVAGGTYAAFLPAAYADSSISLEAVANALMVAALLVLRRRSTRAHWVAGSLLGLSAAVKIWGVVPLLVILGWLWWRDDRRSARRVLAGAAATLVAICGPFFALAPATMWRQVVLDQLNRPRSGASLLERLPAVFGIPAFHGHGGPRTIAVHLLVFLVISAILVALAARAARSQEPLAAVLLLCTTGVLVLSPSLFLQYGAFVAIPLAWCAALAVRGRISRLGWLGACAASCVAVMGFSPGTVLDAGFLARVSSTPGCIVSDDPGALIAGNVLSRNLASGCSTWIDVTGVTYDAPGVRVSNGFSQPRAQSAAWGDIVNGYLESGTAGIHGRRSTGLHPDVVHYWQMSAAATEQDQGYVLHVWAAPGGQRPPTYSQWATSRESSIPWRLGD